MRLAAVGDIHGHENLAAVAADLDRLGPVDLVLLAGDTTDRNDLEAYGAVLQTVRSRISAPIAAVFGNNEYANDHPAYVARFGAAHHVRFLQDAAERGSVGGRMAARAWVQGPRADPASAEARRRDPWAHPQRHSARRVAAVPEPPGRFRGDEVVRADPQRRLSGSSCDRDVRPVSPPPRVYSRRPLGRRRHGPRAAAGPR